MPALLRQPKLPYAMAEGLKVTAILEAEVPNCIFERTGALAVRETCDLERVAAFVKVALAAENTP